MQNLSYATSIDKHYKANTMCIYQVYSSVKIPRMNTSETLKKEIKIATSF